MQEREQCKHCGGKGTVEPWQNLRPIRIAAGISIGELSRRTGKSVTYLSDVELGRRNAGGVIQGIYGELQRRK